MSITITTITTKNTLADEFRDRIMNEPSKLYQRLVGPDHRFRQDVATKGAVKTCADYFQAGINNFNYPPHSGFTNAFQNKCLDGTVEFVVWREKKWHLLFTQAHLKYLKLLARELDFENIPAKYNRS